MFKYIICFCLLTVATAASLRKDDEKDIVPILRQMEEKNPDGSFAFYYEGADGGKREEVAVVKNPGTEDESLVVRGSYSYIDADGQEVNVQYIADENGFRPQGTNIPEEISQVAYDAALRSAIEMMEQRRA